MSEPEFRNAVVLVIDRLGANMLGAYGSTWFETPNFNRLAARSVVFDQAISRTTELQAAYEGLWNPRSSSGNLLTTLSDSGVSSVLLTDDADVTALNLADRFERVLPVDVNPSHKVADRADETELALFFAQAAQAITQVEPGSCLWLHSRGLSGSWDAPVSLRTQLADPEDPAPPDLFEPPTQIFDPTVDDPDQILGYQQVCAAQVTMIDDFLGVILDLLESDAGESTLFCLMSTRGYPLGEHGIVGAPPDPDQGTCYSESVHVPLMVCLPSQPQFDLIRAIRSGRLIQPAWVTDWLIDWLVGPSAEAVNRLESFATSLPEKSSELAFTVIGQESAIQTHAWKLIRSRETNELFAKPDDRCEINDVSRRCPGIVDSLNLILEQMVLDPRTAAATDYVLEEQLSTRVD